MCVCFKGFTVWRKGANCARCRAWICQPTSTWTPLIRPPSSPKLPPPSPKSSENQKLYNFLFLYLFVCLIPIKLLGLSVHVYRFTLNLIFCKFTASLIWWKFWFLGFTSADSNFNVTLSEVIVFFYWRLVTKILSLRVTSECQLSKIIA